MDAPEDWTLEQIEERMRAVDDRARLVSTRVLRRIIKQEQRTGPLTFHLTHRRSLTIAPRAALDVVDGAELGLSPVDPRPDFLLLIERPESPMPESEALGWIWRRVFHARVHAALDSRIADGLLRAEDVRQRIAAIGRREFAEIRAVLDRDGWLLSPRDDTSVYMEFVAVFLELRHFAEELLPTYFPGIEDLHAVVEVIRKEIDGNALFDATRPVGAPDPAPHAVEDDLPEIAPLVDDAVVRSEGRFRWLLARADRARASGNVVRSAILRARAARLVGPSRAGQARSGSTDDVAALSRRLAVALDLEPIHSAACRSALGALVGRTDRSLWCVEARLLYDLQNICIDHEREVFELDLSGWLLSGFERPIKRPLPNQRLIRTSKHLRKAASRLAKSGIDEASRGTLTQLIRDATHTTESRLRERFRPLIARALERADIRPTNLPERISFLAMTEELLDRIAERDYLTMGEVRDAVARGDLRQSDLSGPREFVQGDRVLRANRRLSVSLEGVYHSGEIYLRALQRASLVMFGTRVGRLFVRYVALPYGGAVGALITIQELLGFARVHVELANRWTVAVLGTFMLLLLHSRRFLAVAKTLGSVLWRGVSAILVDAPMWVLARPLVQAFLKSRTYSIVRRLALQPAACAAVTYALADWLDHDRRVAAILAAVAFTLTAAFLNTSSGRELEEAASDAAIRGWRRLRVDLLPGLARFILDVFAAILEAVDRVIYAVDEKLRFRSGDGRASLVGKAVLGAFWGVATYIVRIFINLLVEPTINPIKHFPTVTVAAKMLLPYLKVLYESIASEFVFLGPWVGGTVASVMVIFLPGLAGFIVWELKENWKLFEANRPTNLQPVMIGHHGETMRRLLLPGFHSGTIPALFTKLRRAERDAYRTGHHAAARKVHQAIEHVEMPIRHFVERGLGVFLVESGRFSPRELLLEHVRMSTNRVELVLITAIPDGCRLHITFENEDGRLMARVCDGGLQARLTDEQNEALNAATLGLAARAGAEAILGDASIAGCVWLPANTGTLTSPVEAFPPGCLLTIPWKGWIEFWSAFDRAGKKSQPLEIADELTH